jgi:hypothetical protein
MRTGSRRLATAAAALTLTIAAALGAAVPANATPKLGTRSLAAVLAADGDKFDRNWNDYDILAQAVGAVLAAKPNSSVGMLADGKVALTAFLPSDRAFRSLAADLTGKWYRSESELFTALATLLGIDTIEAVLLYHVVPGATITSKTALKSDGAKLTTALPGGSLTVDVLSKRYKLIRLIDADRTDADPWLNPWALDINRGNRQIAHGIFLVLRPLDI